MKSFPISMIICHLQQSNPTNIQLAKQRAWFAVKRQIIRSTTQTKVHPLTALHLINILRTSQNKYYSKYLSESFKCCCFVQDCAQCGYFQK